MILTEWKTGDRELGISGEGRGRSCWVSDDAGGRGAAAAPLCLSSLHTLSNRHLGPGIGPVLRLPLSCFPWCSFTLGHMQFATFTFPIQVWLSEEFTFKALFWRRAILFSLSLD